MKTTIIFFSDNFVSTVDWVFSTKKWIHHKMFFRFPSLPTL